MNFQESVSYLYSLGNEVTAMKLGLNSSRKLLAALGNPHEKYLKVQVAGTNGKGSTCAFLESICYSAGISVGTTTSPHLISITERVRIGGREIGKRKFARHATRVRETAEELVRSGELESVPTFFEQVTAIALNAFAEEKVELAILETGLGGRFDAVTAANAEIVAITPIDYDHQKILGDTLAEIAAEKAAIIREDTCVAIAAQKPEAKRVIEEKCLEKRVKPIWATTDVKIRKYEIESRPMISVSFKTEKGNYPNMDLNLAGRHQTGNAALAIAIAEILRDNYGFEIADKSFWMGLATAKHEGRLDDFGSVLLDGAHNRAGAQALADYLDEFVRQPITMIFGAMRDKDLGEIAKILFPKAEKLILTQPKNERAFAAEELRRFVPPEYDESNLLVTTTVREAWRRARKITEHNGVILFTGSLYLVGEAKLILAKRKL